MIFLENSFFAKAAKMVANFLAKKLAEFSLSGKQLNNIDASFPCNVLVRNYPTPRFQVTLQTAPSSSRQSRFPYAISCAEIVHCVMDQYEKFVHTLMRHLVLS
ncbi:hypothetical protein AVEN_122939-1 [Araneus ventricosus]|uniref:Uncharacterized protein n=1 Tax=Araneus ventricosus TaxID=182803 RepID=A0A4Y2KQ91_ARAVE|nr:hypothetical protein AVEN_122939-1 [Araneus ventricosus]